MKRLIPLVLIANPALAEDCKLEHWKFSRAGGGNSFTYIEGTTTCRSGSIIMRVYDGDKFLGTVTGHIQGFAFKAVMQMTAPKQMQIKYVIENR